MRWRLAAVVAFVAVLGLVVGCSSELLETEVTSEETRLLGNPEILQAKCGAALYFDDRLDEVVRASWDTEWVWPPKGELVGAASVLMIDGSRKLAACEYKGNLRFTIVWMGDY